MTSFQDKLRAIEAEKNAANKKFADVDTEQLRAESMAEGNSLQNKLKQIEAQKKKVIPVPTSTPSAKPLFKPTVKMTITPEEEAVIQVIISAQGFTDFTLEVPEKTRILSLRDKIVSNISDHQFISDYGNDVKSDDALEKLSDIMKSDLPDQIRKGLSEILAQTQRVDVEAIKKKKKGFFSMFSDKVSTKEEFEQVEKSIKQQTYICQLACERITKLLPTFNEQAKLVDDQFRYMTVLIIAGVLAAKNCVDDIELKLQQPGDMFQKQQLNDKKLCIERFNRRISNLLTIRQTVLLRMAQLRLEQGNILGLIDQTNDMVTVVIPMWKQQILTLFSSSSMMDNNSVFSDLVDSQKNLQDRLTKLSGVKENGSV